LASAPVALDEAVAALVAAANRHGGRDNITVALVEFDEVSAVPPREVLATSQVPLPAPAAAPLEAPPASPLASAPRTTRYAKRRRRFTWRVALFWLLLMGLVGGTYFILQWYATNQYYIAEYQGTVVIYQGPPNGFLWFHPQRIETPYKISDLRPVDQEAVKATLSEPSLPAAIHYATYLATQGLKAQGSTSTTTTTTTVLGG
jgi:hypothetical protein